MTDKIPLSEQCDAGIAILNAAMATNKFVATEVRPKIDALRKTLDWMKQNADVLKAAAEYSQNDWLKKAKQVFPDAEVTGIE